MCIIIKESFDLYSTIFKTLTSLESKFLRLKYRSDNHSGLSNRSSYFWSTDENSMFCFLSRRVWRYHRGKHNPYIEKEQTKQWPKEQTKQWPKEQTKQWPKGKGQEDQQRSTQHTHSLERWWPKMNFVITYNVDVTWWYLETRSCRNVFRDGNRSSYKITLDKYMTRMINSIVMCHICTASVAQWLACSPRVW